MEDFTSNSEYHFIKNLTPRLYKLDQSYKLNKPKLMRDIRMLRKCLDGKIPPVSVNDPEQLRILISKCKKSFDLDIDAPDITDSRDHAKMMADKLPMSPVKNTYSANENDKEMQRENCPSGKSSVLPSEEKQKKNKKRDKKRHKKHKRKKRHRYSSSSSSDGVNEDFIIKKRPAHFDRFTNYSASFSRHLDLTLLAATFHI
ncbi:mediator of RNA polymerase II transcription subunit 19-B-like [Dendronephthya gigantea]|uniref:mediator of RNA polymerase II transcription subunit 19-B-like n=1 Tax=Dendronephthya gigantea TaxID=151771 RepID=UPI00106A56F3|nr:mediator of RNA polymerase II transcription subunit 19-B-like [Dendronephthya gigantea]